MQKQVGIMGGTFNPIHMGHLMLAEKAREEFSLDQVLFMPSGISYLKANETILPGEDRFKMVSLAVQENPHFAVSDLEIRREGNTYTWETLEALHRESQSVRYTFLMGADSLFQIENWLYPERIFATCRLGVAIRDDMDAEACQRKAEQLMQAYGAEIVILKNRRIDISSTDIRERIEQGRDIRYLVPDSVREYILEQHFYSS